MTRRVSPLLVTSNTIFDVARRGKTLLVTSNIKPQVPLPRSKCETEGVFFCQHTLHPSLARKARRRRCCFCRHTLHPSLARNARRRGVSLSTHHHQPLPRSKRETEGCFFCRHTTTLARSSPARNCPPPPLPCSKQTTNGDSAPSSTLKLSNYNIFIILYYISFNLI